MIALVAPAVLSAGVIAASIAAGLSTAGSPTGLVEVDALATLAGSICLGAAVLQRWLTPADIAQAWRSTAVWAGVWFVSSTIVFLLAAADMVGTPAARLTAADLESLLHSTTLGQWGMVGLVCPLMVCCIAVDSARGGLGWHPAVIVVLAALGLVSGPVTGHMSAAAIGWVMISLHVLAASLWIGPLLAAAVIVRERDSWSRLLPEYSRLAFWCVVSVAVSGLAATAVRFDTSDVSLGYCILVATKAVLLASLIAGGRYLRHVWVGRECSPAVSMRRAGIETAVMAIAIGVAAALSYTP